MRRVIEVSSMEDLQRKVKVRAGVLNGLNFKPFTKYSIEIEYNEKLYNRKFGTYGLLVTKVQVVDEHDNRFSSHEFINLTHYPSGIELDPRTATFEEVREVIKTEDLSNRSVSNFLQSWVYYKRNAIRNRNSKLIADNLPRFPKDYRVGGIPILFLEEYKGKDIVCNRTLKEAQRNGWVLFNNGGSVIGFRHGVKTISFICKAEETTEETTQNWGRDEDDGVQLSETYTVTTRSRCHFPDHHWVEGASIQIDGLPNASGTVTVDTSNGDVRIISIKGYDVHRLENKNLIWVQDPKFTMELATQIVSNIL
jgi:hypothetical protein